MFCLSVILFFTSWQAFSEEEFNLKQLLLMPGDVSSAHAKIEKECHQCHVEFDQANQSPLCLDCHKEVNKDLKNNSGFHGHIPQAKITNCSSCHTDHKGRDFDITSLDIDNFDHKKTDFLLKGRHQSLACSSCHKTEDKGYRVELITCLGCHQDPHKSKLSNDCLECHNQESWQVKIFDHSRSSFLLKGKHEKLSCNLCHVDDVSKSIGGKCINCHRGNDKHLGNFGDKCQSCHDEKTWEKPHFNHFEKTKYRLTGQHKNVTCKSCHKGEFSLQDSLNNLSRKTVKPVDRNSCFACHKTQDVHLGNNGENCQQCHNTSEWQKVKFVHNKSNGFNLTGSHDDLTCMSCHPPGVNIKPNAKVRSCNDCHQIIDPHLGNLGENCQDCHQQEKWRKQVLFNHDFTSFPLLGVHQLLICKSCHSTADFTIEASKCQDCHEADDIHQKQLGRVCSDCHNASSWSSWQFDHSQQTSFELEGGHKGLSCALCHKASLKKAKSTSVSKLCISCHQGDDIHQGAFGSKCQKCHTSESFYDFKY